MSIARQKSSRSFVSMIIFAALALASLSFTQTATAQVLIPVTNRVEHVYDHVHNVLYITTPTAVQRWDIASQTLLTPFSNIGSSLSDIDVTSDGQFAYIGDRTAGATSGFVRKVNLSTGVKTNLSYDLGFYERGVDELVIMNNGRALFTTDFAGSGWTPFHEINLATDTIQNSSVISELNQSTGLARGFDRSVAFLQEANISSGPIHTYSAAANAFIASKDTNSFVGTTPAAVNRNGTLIAFSGSLLNVKLNTIELLPGSVGGLQFDPLQDILYIADTSTAKIIAYNTNTLAELGRFVIGESISGGNRMSITDDGKYLFVTTQSGIREITNPYAVSEPATLALLAVGSCFWFIGRSGRRNRASTR